ncbi:MAG: DoxX family protein, partial [Pseudomonadota bacterium]
LLGPGTRSLDAGVFGLPQSSTREWAGVAALVRLSLALTFIVAGVFHGFHKIPTFEAPAIALVVVGLGLAAGMGTRVFAAGAVVVLVAYMAVKGADATGVLGFLNAVKREFALLAAAGVLAVYGGGHAFTLHSIARDVLEGARRYLRRPATAAR